MPSGIRVGSFPGLRKGGDAEKQKETDGDGVENIFHIIEDNEEKMAVVSMSRCENTKIGN